LASICAALKKCFFGDLVCHDEVWGVWAPSFKNGRTTRQTFWPDVILWLSPVQDSFEVRLPRPHAKISLAFDRVMEIK
jgi:hypothetical protein